MQLPLLRVCSPHSAPQQRPAGCTQGHPAHHLTLQQHTPAHRRHHLSSQQHPAGYAPAHAPAARRRHHSIPLALQGQGQAEASKPLQEVQGEGPSCNSGSSSGGSASSDDGAAVSRCHALGTNTISSGSLSSGSTSIDGVAISRRHAMSTAAALTSLLSQFWPWWTREAAAAAAVAAGGKSGIPQLPEHDESTYGCGVIDSSRGDRDNDLVQIMLERDDGVFCLSFTLDGRPFRGVLDTGGPFLTVGASFLTVGAPAAAGMTAVGGGVDGGSNGSCAYWGCWRGEGQPSGLEDTFEMFASQDGVVQWRRGDVRLGNVRLGLPTQTGSLPAVDDEAYTGRLPAGGFDRSACSHLGSHEATIASGTSNSGRDGRGSGNSGGIRRSSDDIIFGVFRSLIMKGGAGDQSLVGLVRNTAPGIRPSLLGQTPFRCFELDFAAGTLTLDARSPSPLLPPGADWAPLVDLRRLGAPSQQYVVQLSAVYVNGRRLTALLPDGRPAPLYGMLDSGSTGLFVSERLFYSLQREAGGWRSCDVEFQTVSGVTQRLSAARPDPQFLAFATDFPWLAEEEGYMFVLGMAFLEGTSMAVDMEESRLLLRA